MLPRIQTSVMVSDSISYITCSPGNFGEFSERGFGNGTWRGFLVHFLWPPVSHETKHDKSSKISGEIQRKCGAKLGPKIPIIRGAFVLQLFRPNTLLRFRSVLVITVTIPELRDAGLSYVAHNSVNLRPRMISES